MATMAGTGSAAPAARRERKMSVSHAIWWGLFAVGGMVAAVLLPIHILIQGVLGPLGIVPAVSNEYDTFAQAVSNPLVKLYLFVLISLPLFHAAHRIRFLIVDLGIGQARTFFAALLYGGAVLGTLVTAVVLLSVP